MAAVIVESASVSIPLLGAGLGRTATFSLKFALEHVGLGSCYHMSEVFAGARRNIPLWLDVARGRPDWDTVFDGYQSTTDYPACSYWRELAGYYPNAKIVLTVRDADSWFDSVTETIFSEQMQGSLAGSPVEEMMRRTVFDAFGGRVKDREFMTDWFIHPRKAGDRCAPSWASRCLLFLFRESTAGTNSHRHRRSRAACPRTRRPRKSLPGSTSSSSRPRRSGASAVMFSLRALLRVAHQTGGHLQTWRCQNC